MDKKKIILIGGGGHCKVVISQLKKLDGFEIAGILDNFKPEDSLINDIKVIGTDDNLAGFYATGIQYAFITVGSVSDNIKRQKLFIKAKAIGFTFPVIISPLAIIDDTVNVREGTVIMPGCVVNTDSFIGKNCIINTGTIIEHDCRIEDHCHLAPGVKVAGGVAIGDLSMIGIGSSIIQGVKIGRNVTVGAGCVVINDIPDNSVVVGNPGRLIKKKAFEPVREGDLPESWNYCGKNS